jgi:anti-anti-sigma factor
MTEDHFEVRKEGSVLTVVLGTHLSVVNAPALTSEINLYKGQDIEKLVFDATKLTYISSSGIRVILYCKKFLSKNPEIVFVNCNKDILDVFDLVGIIPYITFVTNP